jgi:[ribosomal protein S18]-alanine N-acetyltransferase
MKITIRKTEKTDLPEILEIEKMSFREPWKKISFEEEIRDHESFTLLSGEEIAGYICGWKILDEYNITNLAIRPDLYRKGYADLLVSHLINIHKDNCRLIYLEVRESNIAAQNLYRKKGFKIVGIRRNYYLNPEEDAIIMGIKFPQ